MDYYNVKVINDIIYNDETHLVSLFKDYLILDDISEFLKRYYTTVECTPRLDKIYNFYDQFSKVFPNYIILEESKYMFKNIERKQIAIDEWQRFFQELEAKEAAKKGHTRHLSQLLDEKSSIDQLFDTNFIDSVAWVEKCSQINDSLPVRYVSQLYDSKMSQSGRDSMISEAKEDKWAKRIADYSMEELVKRFLIKDSMIIDEPTKKHGFEYDQKRKKPPSHPNKKKSQYIEKKNVEKGIIDTHSEHSSANLTASVQGSIEENREKIIWQKVVER